MPPRTLLMNEKRSAGLDSILSFMCLVVGEERGPRGVDGCAIAGLVAAHWWRLPADCCHSQEAGKHFSYICSCKPQRCRDT